MQFKDYYQIIEVARDATQDEIKRSYRKLARKYHPDVSKESDAEARFKELGEAYEVLRDEEKRVAYDRLGVNWKGGQEFRPPPDWNTGFGFRSAGSAGSAAAEHSDFFESLFGRSFQTSGVGRTTFNARGEDHHAKVLINLEDTYHGATRTIALQVPVMDAQGHVTTRERILNVSIPKGIREGQHIRLSGQGSAGVGKNKAGDLYLQIEFQAHPLYRIDGRDLYLNLPVAPWEAALGATVKVPTLGGIVELKIPEGSLSGSKLRLKGRGLPGHPPGNCYVIVAIALPPANTEAAKDFYRKMKQELNFNPRTKLGV
ncbi:MAG: J domain-containing protein [Betaproteobacteria bacterium]|nr:MAG: J domain-containing protein [Betaproteobacteria bacterium]TDI80021.1 MAG: J domain-containing protein [Betaproteobacteria bacterium]